MFSRSRSLVLSLQLSCSFAPVPLFSYSISPPPSSTVTQSPLSNLRCHLPALHQRPSSSTSSTPALLRWSRYTPPVARGPRQLSLAPRHARLFSPRHVSSHRVTFIRHTHRHVQLSVHLLTFSRFFSSPPHSSYPSSRDDPPPRPCCATLCTLPRHSTAPSRLHTTLSAVRRLRTPPRNAVLRRLERYRPPRLRSFAPQIAVIRRLSTLVCASAPPDAGLHPPNAGLHPSERCSSFEG